MVAAEERTPQVASRRPTSASTETVTVGTGGLAGIAWRGGSGRRKRRHWGTSSFDRGSTLSVAAAVRVGRSSGCHRRRRWWRKSWRRGRNRIDLWRQWWTSDRRNQRIRRPGRHGHGSRQHDRQRRVGWRCGAGIAATPVASSRRILGRGGGGGGAGGSHSATPAIVAGGAGGKSAPSTVRQRWRRGLRTARAPRLAALAATATAAEAVTAVAVVVEPQSRRRPTGPTVGNGGHRWWRWWRVVSGMNPGLAAPGGTGGNGYCIVYTR